MHSFLNRRVKQFLCDFFWVCPPRTNLCYLLFKSFKSNEKCRHNEMRRQLFFQLVLIERVVGFNVHGCPHPSGFEHKKRLPTFCLDEKNFLNGTLFFEISMLLLQSRFTKIVTNEFFLFNLSFGKLMMCCNWVRE